ncbi:CAAX farnesyltransferase (FTase) subunit beta [Rhinocladiella similis]
MATSGSFSTGVPAYLRRPVALLDSLDTDTSRLQSATISECLPLLNAVEDPSRSPFDFNEFGLPSLEKEEHVQFLQENLAEFPAPFVGIDASRPWMVYWALLGLYLLGEDVSPFRSRVVTTFYSMQNATGGFGGGFGQYSHLAGTYAGLLSLALVGGEEAYSLIDRKAMWHWLGRLKEKDGGFRICEDGEEDVRGAYCALVALSLLSLPLSLPPDSAAREAGFELFTDGLGEYLSRCQTYEGGIASSPGSEAHGAYAFCTIACLCLHGAPHDMSRFLDMGGLLSWLSARQYAPEGGLAGRTNKLVDGCYSHWVGTCWPLVEAALDGPRDHVKGMGRNVSGNLYSSEGLSRYILCCCQGPQGGLRDKPSKLPDSYHTCYNLVGLSNVGHAHTYGNPEDSEPLASAFTWEAARAQVPSEGDPGCIFDTGARVRSLNPVFVIPHDRVLEMRTWTAARPLEGAR